MADKKTPTQAGLKQQAGAGGEPPFDRGFWSGRKGHAIGSAETAGLGNRPESEGPLFGGTAPDGTQAPFPADLRRSGPFSQGSPANQGNRGKTDTHTARHSAVPKAADDAKISGIFSSKPHGDDDPQTPETGKPVLQLDDFEPRTKAWRRTKKEPVAPRVHPNPKPVAATAARTFSRRFGKSGAGRKENPKGGSKFRPDPNRPDSGYSGQDPAFGTGNRGPAFGSGQRKIAPGAPLATKTADLPDGRSSFVLPVVLLFGLFCLVGAGYVYLSKLSQQTGGEGLLQGGSQEIRNVEIMLNDLDFSPGRIDGKADAELVKAIRDFQQFAGLRDDGEISAALITELQAVTEMLGSN